MFFNNLFNTILTNIPDITDNHLILMGDLNIAKEACDIVSGSHHSKPIRLSLTNFRYMNSNVVSDKVGSKFCVACFGRMKNYCWSEDTLFQRPVVS